MIGGKQNINFPFVKKQIWLLLVTNITFPNNLSISGKYCQITEIIQNLANEHLGSLITSNHTKVHTFPISNPFIHLLHGHGPR